MKVVAPERYVDDETFKKGFLKPLNRQRAGEGSAEKIYYEQWWTEAALHMKHL